MAEDTPTQHDVPPSPGKDLEKISVNPPAAPTPSDTMIHLDPPPYDANDKGPHTDLSCEDLSELASIDTSVLIDIFGLLTNFEKSENDLWDLIGMPDPEGWELVQTVARAVEKVTVIQQPFEGGTITPTTFVRIARMLAGEPLFPNLHHLQIEDLSHSTGNYLTLLAVPSLEHVTLTYHPTKDSDSQQVEDTNYSQITMALFADLTFYSKQLKILHAEEMVPAMPMSLLQTISNFSELRVLKLECLLRVPSGAFKDYIQCLERLRSLEALWLRLEEIVTDGSSPLTPGIVEVLEPISILPDLLPMTQLDIVGPAHLVVKTISTFGSRALKKVSISLSRTSKSLTGLSPFLKKLTSPALDLSQLKEAAGLEVLDLSHCVLAPSIELFQTGVWLHLVSLTLPSSMVVNLAQLRNLAEALPSLHVLRLWLVEFGKLSVPVDLSVTTEVPLHHPLEHLSFLNTQATSHDLWQKLVPWCIHAARYLNALFPALQSLTTGRDAKMWQIIFELMKLCQTSLIADKNRRHIFPEM